MTNNILVTSAGFNTINNYVSEDNIKLFKEISNGKKVLIIANAAPPDSGNYIARENVLENFLKVGASKVDLVDINKDNENIILDYDVIYVLGGTITYLVNLVKETNFKSLIYKFLEKGIYIGESAGSMILSDDVEWVYDIKRGTKPKYDIILDSYEGLGLIDFYPFSHYQKASEEVRDKINKCEINRSIKITRMNDGDIITYNYKNTNNS